MHYKNSLLTAFTISFVLLLHSCGDKHFDTESIIEEELSELVSEKQDTLVEETIPELDSTWNIYEGNCGLYQQHIVMELTTRGTEVYGSYFYTKHQKSLTLTGTIDTITNQYTIEESYKGKTTGYMSFWVKNGSIEGSWMKEPNTTDKEAITAELLETDIKSKADYAPVFKKYKLDHNITFYTGEGEEINEVTDDIIVCLIGNTHFSFDYHVIGRNAHLGSIDGLAIMKDKNSGVFSNGEGCGLTFEFEKHLVDIKVDGDCSPYGGHHAHFGGTLVSTK